MTVRETTGLCWRSQAVSAKAAKREGRAVLGRLPASQRVTLDTLMAVATNVS